jgi:hypothetical protein
MPAWPVAGLRMGKVYTARHPATISSRGGTHVKVTGTSVDCVGVASRKNEFSKSVEARGRGFIRSRQVERWKFIHRAETDFVSSIPQEDAPRTKGTTSEGKRKNGCGKTETPHVGLSPQEDRSRPAGKVGDL